ncbi:mechanosensitive ion channel family protein [Chlorogloeopsis sp. ULAP02]|uniref:mechanosensitive ion channel family protein n=1 Tax=Chlorogloeopsis sp. ULAP02 TaxID=3107926 RepID=UPI0031367E77
MAIAHIFKRQGWKRSNLLRQFVVYGIMILIVLMSPAIDRSIVLGQLPSLTTPSNTQPPPISVERRGTLESTWVHLDGKELFRIASPAVLNRSEPNNQIPVEVRAKQIEANLALVVDSGGLSDEDTLDPKTLQVLIETVNEQPVLFVKDETLAEAKVLLTVTDTDAQYALVSKDRLAAKWKKILEQELRQALELRQPEALRRQISTVVKALVVTAILTLMLGIAWVFFGRSKQQLERRQAAESALIHTQELTTVEPLDVESGLQLFERLHYHFGLQERFQIVRFVRWLLFWAIAFVWMIGIAYSLNAFPQTRHFAQKVVVIPIVILIAWFLMGLINRLTDFGIDRFIWRWEQEQLLTGANLQRIATIANALKGLKKVLIYTLGIFWVLQWLDLVPVSILALGALFALTVSFVAQSLLKDLVNGFLILLEDQFRIGDYIRVAEVSGKVENLNLRVTQIRSDAGNLITMPNSLIAQVENMSRIWARADFRIEVAYNTNVDRALAVVRETVDQLAQDPQWQSTILDTHELFGVDQISHTGITIRIWIKTAPLKQWRVAQELRRRLKNAFDRHNIQIGIPLQVILENGYGKPDSIEN